MSPAPPPFALFVRAVKGHLVRRYGTPENIGAVADGEGTIVWDCDTVHALTHAEMAQHGREYRRAISDKALEDVGVEAWQAWQVEEKRRGDAALKFFASARKVHAAELQKHFALGDRKTDDLTDEEIAQWAKAEGIDVTAAPKPRTHDDIRKPA